MIVNNRRKIFRLIFTCLFIISGLITTQHAFGQSEKKLIKEAEKALENEDNKGALSLFLKALEKNPDNPKVNFQVGKLYLSSIYKTRSLKYLEKAFSIDPKVSNDIHFCLGLAYHYNHRLDEALEEYEKYKSKGIKDAGQAKLVERKIGECKVGKELMANPVDVKIENIGNVINTPFPEYAPVISADESILIFTSRREGSTGGELDDFGEYYEDIYISERVNGEWQPPKNIGSVINTPGHDASIGLSPDGKELFIYKDDGSGDIYYCKLKKDGTWSKPLPIEGDVNTKRYYENAASVSADNKRIFFASTREGGYGGLDIYMSELDSKGNWGKPVNLGPKVNTEENEEGPFLDLDGKTLYFSSKGHKGMGGFDLFKTVYDEKTKTWSEPVNMGYPLNSADDDIYFVLSGDGRHGYYASVKEDGYGDKDLYVITMPPRDDHDELMAKLAAISNVKPMPKVDTVVQEIVEIKEVEIKEVAKREEKKIELFPVILTGSVKEQPGGTSLAATVQLQDSNGQVVDEVTTGADGKYYFELKNKDQAKYQVSASKDGYGFNSQNVLVPGMGPQEVELVHNLNLKKLEVGNIFILRNIYFDFDRATLKPESIAELKKLEKLLKENPGMKVEIAGHTDSKGSNEYNKILSQRRAEAVVKYLVNSGIERDRLTAKGYGEEKPLASNDDEDEGRELNRRTEFEIISK
ncbi:MAG TPA: OmpA family protein [Cytophagaceae bacterium]